MTANFAMSPFLNSASILPDVCPGSGKADVPRPAQQQRLRAFYQFTEPTTAQRLYQVTSP
jgi:hypothetical protein